MIKLEMSQKCMIVLPYDNLPHEQIKSVRLYDHLNWCRKAIRWNIRMGGGTFSTL